MTNNLKAERTLTAEELQAIIDGCEGVTPGPWDVTAGLVRSIDGDVAIPIFESRDPWKKHRRISTVMRQAWHNRHHVSRCDPDTIKAMATELQCLRSQSLSTQQPMGEVTDDQVKKIAYSLCMHKELRITLGQMAFIEEAVRLSLHPNQESGE